MCLFEQQSCVWPRTALSVHGQRGIFGFHACRSLGRERSFCGATAGWGRAPLLMDRVVCVCGSFGERTSAGVAVTRETNQRAVGTENVWFVAESRYVSIPCVFVSRLFDCLFVGVPVAGVPANLPAGVGAPRGRAPAAPGAWTV